MKLPKTFNFHDTFVSQSGNEARVHNVEQEYDKEAKVCFIYTKTGTRGEMCLSDFQYYFKPKGYQQSVNQDILKLIEAGYEFTSFFGDTVDGRSFSVDLNEEE